MASHIRAVTGFGVVVVAGIVLGFFMMNASNIPVQTKATAAAVQPVITGAQYQLFRDYAPSNPENKRIVYFFAAPWCPTCRSADAEFKTEALSKLPSDVVIVKVDFDSNKELRKKFAINYQHTFVELAPDGSAKQVWVGGGVTEMNQKLGV